MLRLIGLLFLNFPSGQLICKFTFILLDGFSMLKFLIAFLLYSLTWTQVQGYLPFQKQMVTPRNASTMPKITALAPIDTSYELGPGDYLGISFEGNWLTVQVSANSMIQIDKIPPINCEKKTLGEVTQEIVSALGQHYEAETITVSIVQPKTVMITILGAVASTGHFTIQDGHKVSQAFLMAKSFLDAADIPGAQLIRRSGDTLNVDPSQMDYSNDLSFNVELKMGDVLYVPYIDLAKPLVFIKDKDRFNPVIHREGWTIKRYLYGYQLHKWTDGLESYVVHRDGKTIDVELKDFDTFVPQPGDRIEPIEVEQVVLVGGVVNIAGKVPYKKNLIPLEYVSAAGINMISQEPDKFKVLRRSGHWEWVDPIEGVIYPGDFIHIEKNKVELAKDYSTITSFFLNVIISSLAIYLSAKGL